MTMDDFEELVADAIDTIPDEFFEQMENVVFMVEEEPLDHGDAELLGYYDGVALTDRGFGFDGQLPDNIVIFKGPHERAFGQGEELREEVRRTVIHEVGHYFGMTEEQIARMGYQ